MYNILLHDNNKIVYFENLDEIIIAYELLNNITTFIVFFDINDDLARNTNNNNMKMKSFIFICEQR
jgi:hypothetical protein